MSKITDLLVVFDGILQAQLPTADARYNFEKFPTGSCYGLYSVLKHADPSLGRSRFKLVTLRFSWIISISAELLFSMTEKYRLLDK